MDGKRCRSTLLSCHFLSANKEWVAFGDYSASSHQEPPKRSTTSLCESNPKYYYYILTQFKGHVLLIFFLVCFGISSDKVPECHVVSLPLNDAHSPGDKKSLVSVD